MPVFRSLEGMRFGRLVVVRRVENNKHNKIQWLCICDCGNQKIVIAHKLSIQETQSCGCLRKEITGIRAKTHGNSHTRLYKIWAGMKKRCDNPKASSFKNYGKIGITIDPRWREFELFREWSLSAGYNDSLSIDRIDVNKGYYPENCRWTSEKVQANNKRNNRRITINGQTNTMKVWSEISGIGYSTFRNRVRRGVRNEKLLFKGRAKRYELR